MVIFPFYQSFDNFILSSFLPHFYHYFLNSSYFLFYLLSNLEDMWPIIFFHPSFYPKCPFFQFFLLTSFCSPFFRPALSAFRPSNCLYIFSAFHFSFHLYFLPLLSISFYFLPLFNPVYHHSSISPSTHLLILRFLPSFHAFCIKLFFTFFCHPILFFIFHSCLRSVCNFLSFLLTLFS